MDAPIGKCTWILGHLKEGSFGISQSIKDSLFSLSHGWFRPEKWIYYYIYRFFVFCYCLIIFILWCCSKHTLHVFVYLTTWTYSAICLYLFLALLGLFIGKYINHQRVKCVVQIFWWVSGNISATFAFIVTIVALWADVDGEDKVKFLNINVHILNSVITFVDVIISKRPMRCFGFIPPLTYGVIYVAFSGIYFACTGEVIYKFLDWNDKRKVSVTVGVVLALIGGIHLVWLGVMYVCGKCFTSSKTATEAKPLLTKTQHEEASPV